MKKFLALGFALGCLGGCASYTPKQVVEEGARTEQPSRLEPRQAAGCLARNGQNLTDLYWATVLELAEPNNLEVVFNAPSMPMAGAIMVMHVHQAPSGSLIRFFASPRLSPNAAAMWTEKLGKGC